MNRLSFNQYTEPENLPTSNALPGSPNMDHTDTMSMPSPEQEVANSQLVRDFVNELPHTVEGRFRLSDRATATLLRTTVLWTPGWPERVRGSIDVRTPYFIVGEKPAQKYGQTQLLLAQAADERLEQLPDRDSDYRRLQVATVLSSQLQVAKRASLVMRRESFESGQWEEMRDDDERVVSHENSVMRTRMLSGDRFPFTAKLQLAGASSHGMYALKNRLNNSLDAKEVLPVSTFQAFEVSGSLESLAEDFGKQDELQQLRSIYNA